MLLFDRGAARYGRSPLIETICQLKFPAILSIGSREPADFQEEIREDFPRYTRLNEQAAPKLVNPGTPQARFETPAPTVNHQFLSADNRWKINLANGFVALSTLSYPGWEEFARMLDKVAAAFIAVYRPAFFERIGLRYINGISRTVLGLEDRRWSELINPRYLGPLADPEVREESVPSHSEDFLMEVAGGTLKLKAALADFKRGEEQEKRFLLDLDVSMKGNLELSYTAGTLSSLHLTAKRAFGGAVTDALHEAMAPVE